MHIAPHACSWGEAPVGIGIWCVVTGKTVGVSTRLAGVAGKTVGGIIRAGVAGKTVGVSTILAESEG